jgi:hypothetical protein
MELVNQRFIEFDTTKYTKTLCATTKKGGGGGGGGGYTGIHFLRRHAGDQLLRDRKLRTPNQNERTNRILAERARIQRTKR